MNIEKSVIDCLPKGIQQRISEYPCINEIRIRNNAPLCITVGTKNYICDYTISQNDIDFCIKNFCKNSVHTYFEHIKKGYIPFDNGYRIGVCGTAIADNENIKNISKIQSLNIRVPSDKFEIPNDLIPNIKCEEGVLIYSPPNYGKTSLLKVIISTLSRPPYNRRISVVDPKSELYSETLHKNSPVDFYTGYPKYTAIDMAIRNMSPEVLVCDEIGINDDISALVECKNCGVSLVCSAHAKNLKELLTRRSIFKLHCENVFSGYLGIYFEKGKRIYDYKKREDIVW